jgi:hypothetical protein
MAYVRSAAPAEVARVWATCRSWPWRLGGGAPALPPGLVELMGSHPIPVHWVGPAPPGLAGRAVEHRDWMELVAALDGLRALADRGVNGVRLLRNRGLQAPDGRIVLDVVNLEGLLAAPVGLELPPNGSAERAAAVLEHEIGTGRLPLRLELAGNLLRLR